MKEEHLHFIWKYLLFDVSNLKTTFGDSVHIIKNGLHNANQGPDFLQAHIKIGETLHVGNVELHMNNEDWYAHKHTKDKNYDNTILHVVFYQTNEIYTLNSQNTSIPILVLENYISSETKMHLQYLMNSKLAIPCIDIYKLPDAIKISGFKSKLLVERLEQRSNWIYDLFLENDKNIETTFYQAMMYGFGLKVNASIFLQIAQSLPQNVLGKHSHDLFQLEALFLGQANLLESTEDYALKLRNEYQYLKQVYHLKPLNVKPLFSKLLPPSFPSIRLVQFATFIHQQRGLYSKLKELKTIEEIRPYFDIKVSDYWQHRVHFNTPTQRSYSAISNEFINKIILNVIIPFLYTFEKYYNRDTSRIIDFMNELPKETNAITKRMAEELKLKNKNAYDSQALIEWHNSYCLQKKCTNCVVGFEIFK